jgi:inosine-uridine nucleoside N-ribohydrolase/formylmethanofuran dehydrogenase subunit E
MKANTILAWKAILCIAVVTTSFAVAHDIDNSPVVVIDSDMGIDDAVTLALALQCPQIRLAGLVATEGVAGSDVSAHMLGQMLDEFNRADVSLYLSAPRTASRPVPQFRGFAEAVISKALRGALRPALSFTPRAYADPRGDKVTVLALGPLTNLAVALNDESVRKGIERVMIQGAPESSKNWNLQYDPDAFAAVLKSGVPLQFVENGTGAAKPAAWRTGDGPAGQKTSIGEELIGRLLSEPNVRNHYTQGVFAQLTDELLVMACIDHDLFDTTNLPSGNVTCLRPKNPEAILKLFMQVMSEGRQAKNRVVFAPGSLPNNILRADVRKRKAGIVAKNGETEWFAQLMMNELHDHLGSYSIMGVKMGLRAAELLNAPQHGMHVVSYSAAQPPVSCLNDGIIVGTGSTPGRALFRHEPGPAGSTRVTFTYNGRQVTLAVKDEYRKKVQARIDDLLKVHTLEDAEYWESVREASLEIWEHWHRRDLFDVIERSPTP